ncbi:MAG TPA: DUF4105 domain-containing protein [Puia sp.]|nr:DUF4105 domain-containing protein [Puia sp.]
MKIFCSLLLIVFLFFTRSISFSQTTDTCRIRISLLTCGPGEELYSIFGHTAIRVVDSSAKMDFVCNYGTFDDSDPYFYFKFTRGIMRYALSIDSFTDFMREYISDKRSVTEQILQLSCNEKEHLFDALNDNASEKNRYYNYQFYVDNCTTRARDIIKRNTIDQIIFKNILPQKVPTFRELIDNYLDSGLQYWNKFGIDLLLGSQLDKRPTNEQAMFLPDYLMKGFDSASHHGEKLVGKKQILLEAVYKPPTVAWFTPFTLFSAIALVFVSLSFSKNERTQKLMFTADIIFYLLLGLLGLTIAFLWLGRVDAVCRNNLNILWALPSHVVMAFYTKTKRPWARNYFRAVAFIAFILLIGWAWLPQKLDIAFVPLLIIITARSIFISKKMIYG